MGHARRVTIIVNPIAGHGKGPEMARHIEKKLTQSGCDVAHILTDASGHATELARAAVESQVDTVLVCGGDGTINEAVQALAGTETALAVLPIGTANVLARELGLESGPTQAAELVLSGRRRKLDLGRAAGKYFICMASAGFDAYVTELMARWRRGRIGYTSYILPTVSALLRYPYPPLRVSVDGRALKSRAYHVIIGNVRNYGGPFTMTPNAKPDDGLLDAVVFGAPGRGMLVLYMAATTVHVHHRFRSVEMVRGKRIDVESDLPVAVQLDGDFKMHTPVSFEVVPKAVNVLWQGR